MRFNFALTIPLLLSVLCAREASPKNSNGFEGADSIPAKKRPAGAAPKVVISGGKLENGQIALGEVVINLKETSTYIGKPSLAIAPYSEKEYIEEGGGGFFYFTTYRYRVPLVVQPGVKVSLDDPTMLIEPAKKNPRGPNIYVVGIPLRTLRQCVDVKTVGKNSGTETYVLCLSVPDKGFRYLETSSGAFAYRSPWGIWTKASIGILTQALDNPGEKVSVLSQKKMAYRFSTAAWWKSFETELRIRQVLGGGASSVSPRWVSLLGGYGQEIGKWKDITFHLTGLVGLENYNNLVSGNQSSTGVYISGYSAPQVGFRSRFIVGSRFEVGGDFLYTIIGNTKKFFIEGDILYYLGAHLAVGSGYWVDHASAQVNGANYSETSVALELYLRYVFGF